MSRALNVLVLLALLPACSERPPVITAPAPDASGSPGDVGSPGGGSVDGAGPPGGWATTRVFPKTLPGPTEPGTRITATAGCPGGMAPISGGVNADLATGKPPSPSIRLNGTFPVDSTGAPAASGDRPGSWTAVGATGGQPERDGQTTGFVICAEEAAPDSLVAVKSVPGPEAAGSSKKATATCPGSAVALGGGGRVDLEDGGPAPRHFFLTGSYPSNSRGVAIASGIAHSWTAVGAIGGMPLREGRVTAFAICAVDEQPAAEVAQRSVRGPASPGSFVRATAGCPAGKALLGGGASTGLPRGGNPPQGLHLRGSFPSNLRGVPVGVASEAASAWTAIANAGGMIVLGARTTAFAICG